jgi:hypothetical protein
VYLRIPDLHDQSRSEIPCRRRDDRRARRRRDDRAVPEVRVERFPLALVRERWSEFLSLEHATLPLPLVDRARTAKSCASCGPRPPGRRVEDGRIPRTLAPELLLQAAAVARLFRAFGIALRAEDLTRAHWERTREGAKLWLAGSPAALSGEGDSPCPSRALAALLDRVAGTRRARHRPAARRLRAGSWTSPRRGACGPNPWWPASFGAFPLSRPPRRALARGRTAGSAGSFLRSLSSRAVVAAGRRGARKGGGRACSKRAARPSRADRPWRSTLLPPRSRMRRSGCGHWRSRTRRAVERRGSRPASRAGTRSRAAPFETGARSLPADVEVRLLPSGEAPPNAAGRVAARDHTSPAGASRLAAVLEWLAERRAPESTDAGRSGPRLPRERLLGGVRRGSDRPCSAPFGPSTARVASGRSPVGSTERGAAGPSAGADPEPAVLRVGGVDSRHGTCGGWKRGWRSSRAGRRGDGRPRSPEAPWYRLERAPRPSRRAPAAPWLDLLEAERQAAGGTCSRGKPAMLLERSRQASKGVKRSRERRHGGSARTLGDHGRISRGKPRKAAARARGGLVAASSRALRAPEAMRSLRLEAIGPRSRRRALRLARGAARRSRFPGVRSRGKRPGSTIVPATRATVHSSSRGKIFRGIPSSTRQWRPAGTRNERGSTPRPPARFLSREAHQAWADRRRYAEAAARLEGSPRGASRRPARRKRSGVFSRHLGRRSTYAGPAPTACAFAARRPGGRRAWATDRRAARTSCATRGFSQMRESEPRDFGVPWAGDGRGDRRPLREDLRESWGRALAPRGGSIQPVRGLAPPARGELERAGGGHNDDGP